MHWKEWLDFGKMMGWLYLGIALLAIIFVTVQTLAQEAVRGHLRIRAAFEAVNSVCLVILAFVLFFAALAGLGDMYRQIPSLFWVACVAAFISGVYAVEKYGRGSSSKGGDWQD